MILLRGKCLLGKIPFEPDLATGGSLWNGAGSNGTQIHGASRLLSRHLCRRVWASAGHRDSHLCLLPRGRSEEEGEQHSPLRQAQEEPAPGASSCSQLPGGWHLLCPPNTSPVGSCGPAPGFLDRGLAPSCCQGSSRLALDVPRCTRFWTSCCSSGLQFSPGCGLRM